MGLNLATLTDWLALTGAATGICALFVQAFQYLHSRPKLKIDIKPECIVLHDHFKVEDKENPESVEYKFATHIVITNLGQMSAAILKVDLCAKDHNWLDICIDKILFWRKRHHITMSPGETIIKQTYTAPFILQGGHVWLGLIDAEKFRESLARFPYVYFEITAPHKKRRISKRIHLDSK